jgi:hypothetical protein
LEEKYSLALGLYKNIVIITKKTTPGINIALAGEIIRPITKEAIPHPTYKTLPTFLALSSRKPQNSVIAIPKIINMYCAIIGIELNSIILCT